MPIGMQNRRLLAFALAGSVLAWAGPAGAQRDAEAARAETAYRTGDYQTAVTIWRDRAEEGDVEALFYLGEAYRTGRGVARDLRTAEGYYAQAAKTGHREAADNYGLLLYESGRKQDALPYLAESAKRGDARAQYVLALGHYNGDVVGKNWPRAYALISLADAAGLAQAGRARAQMDKFIPDDERAAGLRLAQEMTRIMPDMVERPVAALRSADVPTRSEPVVQPIPEAQTLPKLARVADGAVPASRGTRTVIGPTTAGKSDPQRVAVPASTVAAGSPASAKPVVQPAPPSIRSAPTRTAATTPTPSRERVATAAPTVREAPRPAPPSVRQGPWIVQLGAFSVAANADRLWSRVSGHAALRGTTRVDGRQRELRTLAAGGFPTREEAQDVCVQLKRSGHDCFVKR